MSRRRPFRARNKGQIIIMLALVIGAMIAMGGLVVDMIYIYAVRVKLVTAVDATALAVARALGRGDDVGAQQIEVLRVANLMFDTNFPNDFMLTGSSSALSTGPVIAGNNLGTSGILLNDPTVPDGMRVVRLTGTVNVPTFFMRIFGQDQVPMFSNAEAARRDVNLMLVMDRSASLGPAAADAWTEVQSAVTFFADQFDNTRDRVGLVSFGTSAAVDVGLNTGFKTAVDTAVTNQSMPASASTNSPMGMWLGFAELLALADNTALNVIVFFTDGQPSAVPGTFPTRTSARYFDSPYCSSGNTTAVLSAFQSGGTFYEMVRFANLYTTTSPAQTWTFGFEHDHQSVSSCTADNYASYYQNYASNIEEAFSSTCMPTSWSPSHAATHGTVNGTFSFTTGPYSVTGCDAAYELDDNDWGNEVTRGTYVWNSARNVTLDIAQQARQHATLEARVYSVGLGGWGFEADANFLELVSNDSDNPGFSSSEPEGTYVYAPTSAQLRQAFATVASEIFRLIH